MAVGNTPAGAVVVAGDRMSMQDAGTDLHNAADSPHYYNYYWCCCCNRRRHMDRYRSYAVAEGQRIRAGQGAQGHCMGADPRILRRKPLRYTRQRSVGAQTGTCAAWVVNLRVGAKGQCEQSHVQMGK